MKLSRGSRSSPLSAFIELKRKHPLAECETCPLVGEDYAPTCGPANAKIAVVSRSPAPKDVQKKRPFSGLSGNVLDHLLEQNGVKRDEVLVTNVVLCRTDAPPTEAIKACAPRLREELSKADTIIAAGAEAAKALTKATSLAGNRGFVHRRNAGNREQRVIVTNNPAIVLRDDSTFLNLVRDFKLAINPLPIPTLPEVRWTNDPTEAREWISYIHRRFERARSMAIPLTLSVDIESKGLDAKADIVSIGFSLEGHKGIAIGASVLTDSDFIENHLAPFLGDKSVRCVWHNGKFDIRNLRDKRVDAKVDDDTLLLSYALDERSDEEQVHSLNYLLMNELGWPDYEPAEVKNWKATVSRLERQFRYEELEALEVPEALYEYNALDAAGTAQLYPILLGRAASDGVLDRPYRLCLLPYSDALLRLEQRGLHYDVDRAADIWEDEVIPKLNEWKAELQLIVGDGNYNPNSAPQNAALVYDKWNIVVPAIERPGKERSVDEAIYTEIKEGRFLLGFAEGDRSGDSEVHGNLDYGEVERNRAEARRTAIRWATIFADYKKLDKQRGTYIEGLVKRAEADPEHRIYTDFKLHNTATGRSSSSRPNLQNITRAKEGLPNIRSLFRASPNSRILQADYSQAELRVIAKLSGDRALGAIYRERRSLHREVATRFYGEGYTYEQYVNTKNMNFGVAYGQGAETFQEKHDIPVDEAREFIKWWWKNFPGVKDWTKSIHAEVLSQGYVQSPFGHRRRFHLITPQNKNAILREAVNFVPQNTAAQLTLWSVSEMVKLGLPVVNTVHDSIILDVPESEVVSAATKMKEIMESAATVALGWDFPFEAELSIGDNWGELDDYAP
jgi:DNA polymerase I